MKTRRILVMSRNIPPAPTGSGVVIGNLAKQFSAEELIIVGSRLPESPTLEWQKQWAHIKYVAYQFPLRIWNDIPGLWRIKGLFDWLQMPWIVIQCVVILLTEGYDAVIVDL